MLIGTQYEYSDITDSDEFKLNPSTDLDDAYLQKKQSQTVAGTPQVVFDSWLNNRFIQ